MYMCEVVPVHAWMEQMIVCVYMFGRRGGFLRAKILQLG